MKIKNYYLQRGKKELLSNVHVEFYSGTIHHMVGGNGVGKSSFAKSIIGSIPYKGTVAEADNISVIGSYTNIPSSLTLKNILHLQKRKSTIEFDHLYELLHVSEISHNLAFKKMSDGQRQKIKLMFFLSEKPDVIILDEFTSSLDKKSMNDVYCFFNDYIQENPTTTIVNITHNLIDLENMEGSYWYMKDNNIVPYKDKASIIHDYTSLV